MLLPQSFRPVLVFSESFFDTIGPFPPYLLCFDGDAPISPLAKSNTSCTTYTTHARSPKLYHVFCFFDFNSWGGGATSGDGKGGLNLAQQEARKSSEHAAKAFAVDEFLVRVSKGIDFSLSSVLYCCDFLPSSSPVWRFRTIANYFLRIVTIFRFPIAFFCCCDFSTVDMLVLHF